MQRKLVIRNFDTSPVVIRVQEGEECSIASRGEVVQHIELVGRLFHLDVQEHKGEKSRPWRLVLKRRKRCKWALVDWASSSLEEIVPWRAYMVRRLTIWGVGLRGLIIAHLDLGSLVL